MGKVQDKLARKAAAKGGEGSGEETSETEAAEATPEEVLDVTNNDEEGPQTAKEAAELETIGAGDVGSLEEVLGTDGLKPTE